LVSSPPCPEGGIEVGTPDAVARANGPGLIGTRFGGTYQELAVTWGSDYILGTVPTDIFMNTVDVAIPLGQFSTTDYVLVKRAGRSSRATRLVVDAGATIRYGRIAGPSTEGC
jgi:hypothetical protein